MKINNVAPVITNNSSPKNQNVAFTSRFTNPFKDPNCLTDLLTLKKQGPMVRDLFTLNAFAFLLGTRLVTSRDKDEKREIWVRDVPTIIIAVNGVPLIQDAFAGLIQKKSGFAFMEAGPQSGIIAPFFNQLFKRPDKNIASYSQLEDWYKFDKNLHSGFKGFTDRLEAQEGNLKKIFSSLSDEIKNDLENLKFNDKNSEFKAKLFDNSDESKPVLEKIIKEFSNPKGNNALKRASWAATIPTLIGFATALVLIGILIPKSNIAITEAINKKRKAEEEADNSNTQPASDVSKATQNFSASNMSKSFKNFVG